MSTNPAAGNTGPLRPFARIIRTLGEELISSEIVAVVELVKNSYDADARNVLVRFRGPCEIGSGEVSVLDDGNGMTLETLSTVWLQPATGSKRAQKRSARLNRRVLGAKGIGRFAAARLGNLMEVASRVEGDVSESYVEIDWRQFDDEGLFLDEVSISVGSRAAEVLSDGWTQRTFDGSGEQIVADTGDHGTTIVIRSLKRRWTSREFDDLSRALSRLIAPELSRKSEDGMSIFLEYPGGDRTVAAKVEPPDVLQHPHYVVRAQVDDKGVYHITTETRSTGARVDETGRFLRVRAANGDTEVRMFSMTDDVAGAAPVECGPLSFEIRAWDRDDLGHVVQMSRTALKDVRRDLDAFAGVSIYRDGFRVFPYGEPHDDWLRLDLRRVQNPTLRLSNNQVFGAVHISADANPKLKDQSNREGLDENEALDDLRRIVLATLARVEQTRFAARPRKKRTVAPNGGGLFAGFSLETLRTKLLAEGVDRGVVTRLLDQAQRLLDQEVTEVKTVLARYQRLATLGQIIDQVLHECRQPVTAINNEAYLGLADVKRFLPQASDAEIALRRRVELIRSQGDLLSTALKRIEPFGGRKRGRPGKLYIESVIADAFAIFRSEAARAKAKVSLPTSQTLVTVDAAEIQEVILNLLQNSLYWILEVPEDQREIRVAVSRPKESELVILFSDSGPGVSKESAALIFDPYFTTRPNGIGLGLAIAGEIVGDYYNGELVLLDSGPLSGANFEVTLRKRV